MKKNKKYIYIFLIWISIFAIGLVKKSFQNDTFYTIKIGEWIMNNGIDMLDHFSYHTMLPYTYPHWLYDVLIFIIYKLFSYPGLYISTICFLIILILLVFKTNRLICKNNFMSAVATFICSLAIAGFATARAQLVSYILFVIEIYFIELFLKKGNKKYLLGLILISLLLCNIHVAVWPFYFILYLPYLAEYIITKIVKKIKIKKENKFTNFLKSHIILEDNNNIKYLFLTMLLSIFTGLITPIGDTPYTYLIKTMMGKTQKYIQEHQMISWKDSPFAIIIAFETIFLALFSKAKLRDIFMISGLILMNIISIRHMALLALIGTICFARVFSMFIEKYQFNVTAFNNFFKKKIVLTILFILVISFTSFMLYSNKKTEYINSELYPVEALNYIKENIDINKMRIFNDYDFGSYLILNNIPVFIDSRADLYTKEFNGKDYDVFDDYEFMITNYNQKFEFYNITHVLMYKKYTNFITMLKNDNNYKLLYEDEHFILFEKLGKSNFFIEYSNIPDINLKAK